MFESAELGRTVDRETFAARAPELREALLDMQIRLKEAGNRAVVVVIAGAEGAGSGETVNLLLDWLDSRGIGTHAPGAPSEEERERPEYYRFWRLLPPKGEIAIFFGSWYTRPIASHSLGQLDRAGFEDALRRVIAFEQMLADEGVTLVKLWLHITGPQQARRFKKLAADPETAWRVTKLDRRYHRTYGAFVRTAGEAIRRTSTAEAPWHVIESWDSRYRHLTVAETLIEMVEREIAEPPAAHIEPEPAPTPPAVNVLSRLDLSVSVRPEVYERELERLQLRIGRTARRMGERGRSVVMLFEGSDAAGKGGCIRRVTQALDARYYRVVPIAAPTDEERARPYLWRFWRHLPRHGHSTIFDRSWYGRVLVERVEGFCSPEDWRRAYGEINAFEEQLTDGGVVLLKFWLATSKEEQLRRFEERASTGYKRYKITPDDWRNREKWDAYTAAACDVFELTSSERAPWHLVSAEDKYHARLEVLRTLERSLRQE